MLRVILDEHGSGSKDLLVKIDASPSHAWIVDSGYLGFFFNTDDENEPILDDDDELSIAKKADVAPLIRLWQEMLLSDRPVCYLPYDLSDQYVGVLRVK